MLTLLVQRLFSQLPALFEVTLADALILHRVVFQFSLGHRLVKVANLLELFLFLFQMWEFNLLLVFFFIDFIEGFAPYHYAVQLFLLKHLPLLVLLAFGDLVFDQLSLLVLFTLKFLVYEFLSLLHLKLHFLVTLLIKLTLFLNALFTLILETLNQGLWVFSLGV